MLLVFFPLLRILQPFPSRMESPDIEVCPLKLEPFGFPPLGVELGCCLQTVPYFRQEEFKKVQFLRLIVKWPCRILYQGPVFTKILFSLHACTSALDLMQYFWMGWILGSLHFPFYLQPQKTGVLFCKLILTTRSLPPSAKLPVFQLLITIWIFCWFKYMFCAYIQS